MSQKRTLFNLNRKLPFTKIKTGALNKRQKFVAAVIALSLGLFFIEYLLGKSGFFVTVLLSLVTAFLFYLSMRKDIQMNSSWPSFILPFFYTLAFGLFYFLVPARFLTRVGMTILYAIGLYSLFLSQNIFIVASIRTIALLSGARIVSFVITLVSYFFLANVVFALHLQLIPTALLLFAFSYILIFQSVWTITLENSVRKPFIWILALSLCLLELCSILWFWPSTPTIIAIFLTGFFYIIVSISQVWFDKRLFRGVIWEYIWVAVIIFSILLLFTSWRG